MELEGAKKTAEQVIGDVKAIKGIFDWFIGLFVSKPAAEAKPVAKAKAKPATKQQQSYEELELMRLKYGTAFEYGRVEKRYVEGKNYDNR